MTHGTSSRPWSGSWVVERLNIAVTTTDAPIRVALTDLVGLAVRRNPRRAHLLVSTVLGKHLPTDPRLVYGTGLLLGALVGKALAAPAGAAHPADDVGGDLLQRALAGSPDAAASLVQHAHRSAASTRPTPARTLVLGYAETATALGHAVADALDVPTLHSTRRPVPGLVPVGGFEEEHSHATSHLLLPENPELLAGDGPVVLVDDELSTGTTASNTIAALHAVHPRTRYLVAALVDLRSDTDRDRMARVAAELGTRIDTVALAAGRVDLPDGVLAAGQQLVAAIEAVQRAAATDGRTEGARSGEVTRVHLPAPPGLRDGGRHGFRPADRNLLEEYLRWVAREVLAAGAGAGRESVHVLGFEELMYAPLRLAENLAALLPQQVTYSTTTRSPVLAVPAADYAIRSRLVFPAHDDPADGPGDRFAYNLAPTTPDDRFGAVVLVIDAAAETPALNGPDGLLTQLATMSTQVVLVVLDDYRPHGMDRRAATCGDSL